MNIKLECPSCNQNFDNISRIPKMLTTCGHTICKECLISYSNNYRNFICTVDHMVSQHHYILSEK